MSPVFKVLMTFVSIHFSSNVHGGAEITGLFAFVVQVLYFCKKTRKCDNLRVTPKTLVKSVFSVSFTGCITTSDNCLRNCPIVRSITS